MIFSPVWKKILNSSSDCSRLVGSRGMLVQMVLVKMNKHNNCLAAV